MKVKMFDKEWEVKNPTYKEKRELWKLNTMTFVGEELNQDKYFELLERVEEISGLKPEDYVSKDDEKLGMNNIDSLLQQIFLSYMGLSDDSKKA
jgi:ribosomal protein L5